MKWQKLTILDLLLLMFAYAVSGSIWSSEHARIGENGLIYARAEAMLWIVVLGNNLASLVILSAQYAFRHRRTQLSGGELLWCFSTLFLTVIILFPKVWPSLVWRMLWLLIPWLLLSSCSALALVCHRLKGKWGGATCHWTDAFGSVACLMAGMLLLYDIGRRDLETPALAAWLWVAHAVIGLVLSSPILFFGRKRAKWEWWELIAVMIPFSLWFGLMFSDLSVGKSLANLGECFHISFAMPVVAFMRVWVGGTSHQRLYAAALIGVLCGVAAGAFFLTPPLPE
jgi:hypothetical protein